MKVVILAGGFGTRISEESHLKPKPMIELNEDQPILWHIMKTYSYYGFNDFIICCGYKAHTIKEYFANYYLHCSDMTFDFSNSEKKIIHKTVAEPWKVSVIDTGLNTMTGGRIKRIEKYIGNEQFMLTYGDGVSDVNIDKLIKYHNTKGKIATLTAVQPNGRFGILDTDEQNNIVNFAEKKIEDNGWINAGYMVFEPEVFKYIENDATVLEREPLETLAQNGELNAYMHHGFWQCMDTLRDKVLLDNMVKENKAPWKKWE